MEQVTTLEDIRNNNAALVKCMGRYRQHDVRKGARHAGGAPQYHGHVVIQLEDGSVVMLYPIWHPESIRPQTEIEAFDGKLVTVTGRVFLEAPNVSEQQPAQNLMLPCLMDIAEIS
jgi:hypothetical protein